MLVDLNILPYKVRESHDHAWRSAANERENQRPSKSHHAAHLLDQRPKPLPYGWELESRTVMLRTE